MIASKESKTVIDNKRLLAHCCVFEVAVRHWVHKNLRGWMTPKGSRDLSNGDDFALWPNA
jgi:hypothetical protein